MAARSQPYRLEGEMTPLKVEQLDEMLQILFDDLRNGNLEIEIDQITDLPLTVPDGGTGLTEYVVGDILYANDTDSLTTLGIGTANYVLQVNAGATAPEWGLVNFDNMTPAAGASTLIGRRSGSTGDWEAVSLGTGLTMSAGAALSVSTGTYAPIGSSYLTVDDETATLTGSRQLIAGTNITLDISVAGDLTISASGGGLAVGDGYWSPLMTGETLTGDPADSEMVLDMDGDAVMVWIAT